ncbi:hypothetical protein VPH35_043754 [Triticum aestivum]|uniref:Transposase, Ptta/En/Spm, plant n=2 Tax=Triticum TaxID=4564 RepID=A0A9R0VJ76_TRITD|nr:unnamed protein product [Triticum turgidum subsp. durum]
MTIGIKASRLAVAIKPAHAARNTTAADGTYDGYIRGVSDLPPAIPNNEDRPIIQPIGKTHWKDIPVVQKGRRPSSVLTCLLKSNHPGILDYDGTKLRYKYEDAYSEKAKQHVRRCFDEWCSEEWIAKSKKYRANRCSSKFKPHKGGSNSMTTISQKMSEQTGEDVNQIQAWVHTHRGLDKSKPLILNTPEATKCLALYDCSNGKPHGTWSLFNGIVNDIEVISEVRATGTSSAALKRRRAEEIEDVHQKESEKTRKAEAYANNVLSWGVGMYKHCNEIQKFLQTLATKQGVPIGEIPLSAVPPPFRSLSPPGSPQQSTIQILENSEESPALCAQQETNPSSINEHVTAASVPAVDDEGMFGGFFSQSGTGALSLSLLSSQLVP